MPLPFEIRPSPMQGLGAFATEAIAAGVRLVEYTGARLTPEEAEARYPDVPGERHHTYLFAIDDDDGKEVFPLWPAREYADVARTGEWSEYTPERIQLDDLLGELLPKLAERGVQPGVFPTPQGKGVTPTVAELAAALREQLEKYGE